MINRLVFLLLGVFLAFPIKAQFIEKSVEPEMEIGVYPQLSGDRGPGAYQYLDPASGLKLNVVVWDYSSSGFFWQRTVGMNTTSDTLHFGGNDIPRNLDVVIGDQGNKIMIAYQWNFEITVKVFSWNGSYYVETKSFQASQNLGTYLFGGPKLAIDKYDNVVLVWRSYGSSTQQLYLARSGDVSGTFDAYSNSLNAFSVADSAGAQLSETESVDVDIFTSLAGNSTVFFVAAYEADSTVELDQYRMSLSDLKRGDGAGISRLNLLSKPSSTYNIVSAVIAANTDSRHPTYRSPGNWDWNEIQDEWAIAVKEKDLAGNRNDIILYKGLNGGNFNRVVLTSGDLTKCPNQSPSITYGWGIYVVWSHNACGGQAGLTGAVLNGWDAIGRIADGFNGDAKHIRRLNSDNHLWGDQFRVESHAGRTDSAFVSAAANLLLAFRNDSTGAICFKEIHESTLSGNKEALSDLFEIYPTIFKDWIEVNTTKVHLLQSSLFIQNTAGKEVFRGDVSSGQRIDTRSFAPGIYIITLQEGNTFFSLKAIKL